MLSINTNISSLVAQHSMKSATQLLNQAVERMTTGYKINHAKDNAANYSIATNLTTKINSYMVAEENCAMGLDLLATANGTLDQISDKLTRLRDLATQASNGTYGAQSLNAINAEANALVDEIERLYKTAEYNGKQIFTKNKNTSTTGLTEPTYSEKEVADMTTLTKAIEKSELISGGKYSISSVEELAKLAEIVNAGTDTTGMTFVLAKNLDLAKWCSEHEDGWVPIGRNLTYAFKGTFDGNGNIIINFKIINDTKDRLGLFGCIQAGSCIKNLGVEDAKIVAKDFAGVLVGESRGNISNCYSTGEITANDRVGGLIGDLSNAKVEDSYSTCFVNGENYIGGLAGYCFHDAITINCYATGDISGNANFCGGLIGFQINNSTISNCFATGNVYGHERVGGLVGEVYQDCQTQNCYSTGEVIATGKYVGGLIGLNYYNSDVINCYATSDVLAADDMAGGIIGIANNCKIINSYSMNTVIGTHFVGGLVGHIGNNSEISNCYAISNVEGVTAVGGLVAYLEASTIVTNCASIDDTLIGSNATTGDLMTVDKIRAKYTLESIRFTEENGWTIVNNKPVLSWQDEAITFNPINFQVSISSSKSLCTDINLGFSILGLNEFRKIGKNTTADFLGQFDEMLATVNAKQTEFGAVENRLNSALDEISIKYENLVSSRSTIRDADIAEVSSEYIRQQILQQASATLMATANQSPSIALQLI